jgi:phage terminase large subunit
MSAQGTTVAMETATDTRPETVTQEHYKHFRNNPISFVRKVLGADPDEQQCRFLMAVSDSDSVAVKSGHGVGKNSCFAWLALWWLMVWPESRVVATAPTLQQLHDILWPEIEKWLNRSPLRAIIRWQATRVSMIGHESTWFATARTSNKPENMQGFHADHLLILVDEASGVKQETLEAVEGARTTAGSKIVMAGNPTQVSGTFYDAFHKLRAFYETLTLSSEKSQHVTDEYCVRLAQKYGRDSDVYRVRVRGEFPSGQPDALIPLTLCDAAIVREDADRTGTIAIGCDPARFGDAESVIYWREGYYTHKPIVRTGLDTVWIAGEIARLVRHIHNDLLYAPRIDVMIDETGLGAGVVDTLEYQKDDLWINVVPVNFGGVGDDEYADTASLLLGTLKEALAEMYLPDDDDTVAQLTTRKYRLTPDGKIKIESKDQMRDRGLPSPDRADALGLCYYQPQNRLIMSEETREAMRRRRGR